MAIGSWKLPMSSAPTEGHTVRYYDPFGTLLSTQIVAEGGNATPPTPPTLDLLTFNHWNHPGTNITRDENIGAIYDTTDGKTYIFIHVNTKTGLQPTIYLKKSTTDQMIIDWGHGDDSVTSNSGTITIQKPSEYTEGWYTITITCAGVYNLGQGTYSTTLFGAYNGTYAKITQKVYFGSNTTTLNNYVFYGHNGLDSILVSSNFTGSIGTSAFSSCYSLASLTLPSGMTGSIGSNAFSGCYSLASLTLPSGMTGSIGTSAFSSCYSLASLTLPSGMTGSIGTSAFYGCYSLASLTLPSGMTGSIGASAFSSCYSLASLTLPSGMTGSIGTQAFYNCYSLASLTLPSALTGLSGSTFRYTRSLKSLTLTTGVTAIGTTEFSDMTAMEEFIFQTATPPTLTAGAFGTLPITCRIYVPDANVADYKGATNWTAYADYIYSINDRP